MDRGRPSYFGRGEEIKAGCFRADRPSQERRGNEELGRHSLNPKGV